MRTQHIIFSSVNPTRFGFVRAVPQRIATIERLANIRPAAKGPPFLGADGSSSMGLAAAPQLRSQGEPARGQYSILAVCTSCVPCPEETIAYTWGESKLPELDRLNRDQECS